MRLYREDKIRMSEGGIEFVLVVVVVEGLGG